VTAILLSWEVSIDLVVILVGDGIFDKLSNEEVAECVWMSVRDVSET
jgi:serine/threonine protein phosphatase PrpC